MKAIHQRFIHDKVTFSKLTLPWIKAIPDIYGIELPEGNNEHNISCIPAGTYKCIPYFSPARQEDCWLLLDVPGRQNIEIHSGNFASTVFLGGKSYEKNTDGCLMYGFGIEENIPMITKSKEAISYLHTTIGLKSTWFIEVRD